MANIAKNIKRLRTEKGITQEAFSKTVNVSRQAISSWETGRTQPDIEMIGTLAEALGVSIEELIYGEKRNIKIDNEEKNYVSTATAVMSVLGGLLLFAGVILILVWCWEHIPTIGKTVFSLIPMMAGFAFSMYIRIRMKKDDFMQEIGATAWAAGNILSVVFINELLDLNADTVIISLIALALTLPVLFIMKSISALTVLYGTGAIMIQSWWSFDSFSDNVLIGIWAAFIITGIAFTHIFRQKLGFSRHRYAQWISLIALVNFIYTGFIDIGFVNPFVPALSAFAFCYMLEKEDELLSPLYLFGTLGNMIALLLCFYSEGDLVGGTLWEEALVILLSALITGHGIRKCRASLKENHFKKWQIAIIGAGAFFSAIQSFVWSLSEEANQLTRAYDSFASFAFALCIFALSVVFIMQGLKENRLYPLNLGFTAISVLAILMLTMLEMDMLIKGCVLLIMGGILMFMNLKITRNKEKLKKSESAADDSSDSHT